MSYLVPLGLAVALLCQSTLACAAWQSRTAAMNGVEGLGGTKWVLSRSLSLSFLPSMFSIHFLPLLSFRAKQAGCTFFRVTNNCHKGAGREGDNKHEKMYREGLARRMSFSCPLEKCKVGR